MKNSIMPGNKPEAWIAVSNARQKIYDSNKVYLMDDEEYQIELYNPTKFVYSCKLYIDDTLTTNTSIVLKPGQRYFLDRFLDKPDKFKFSTYSVGNDKPSLDAISENGKIKIEFFKEIQNLNLNLNVNMGNCGTTTYTQYPYSGNLYNNWPNYNLPNPIYGSGSSRSNIVGNCGSGVTNAYYSSTNSANTSTKCMNTFTTTSAGIFNGDINTVYNDASSETEVETGRTEKGSKSDQKFDIFNGNFQLFPEFSSEYKILPVSQKNVEIGEIRNYCSACKTRIRKQSWKYCPSCGNDLI